MNDYWLPENLNDRGMELAAIIAKRISNDVIGAVDHWLEMPERLVDSPTRPEPARSWGKGFLCLDLGPEDHDTWGRFHAITKTDDDPESVAQRAQVWRLPVTPYRENPTTLPPNDLGDCTGTVDPRTLRIIDLTSMWAGPLCTEILARAGASVIKIEPSSRPDGLRYGDGDEGSGNAQMFVELNTSKEIADIDLRYCSEGGEFHQLIRSADLVITSLSPRANANLGITCDEVVSINPDIALLSITAFASDTPESEWVAYGTGVHATSGLGWRSSQPLTPAFSYLDPIAGLEACAVALGQAMREAPQFCRVSLDRSASAFRGLS